MLTVLAGQIAIMTNFNCPKTYFVYKGFKRGSVVKEREDDARVSSDAGSSENRIHG